MDNQDTAAKPDAPQGAPEEKKNNLPYFCVGFSVLLLSYSAYGYFMLSDQIVTALGAIGFVFSILARFFLYKNNSDRARYLKLFGDILATALLAATVRGVLNPVANLVLIAVFCLIAACVISRDLLNKD